jgi:CubicO group peptidase (beta-lactamase class C family)
MNQQNSELFSALADHLARLAASDLFSGSVLVAQHGIPLFSGAYGLASKGYVAPNRMDTRFNLGSMNKMFTAVAICQLAQRGKMDFNDLVGRHLPAYPNPVVAAHVTVHQLLTHTSGLGDFLGDRYASTPMWNLRHIQDFFPLFVDDPLRFDPGSRWEYSNAGFLVLGAMIESAAGQNYHDYVREQIFTPALMSGTESYEMDFDTPNLAIGYTKQFGERYQRNSYFLPVRGSSAGGGYSTAEDMLRFDQALRSCRLLSPSYTEVLLSDKVPIPGRPDKSYAYGFFVRRWKGIRVAGHGGSFPGINSSLGMYLGSGHTVAVMSNYDPPIADEMVNWIEEHVLGALIE